MSIVSEKIRVMHVLGSDGPGGAETFFIRLVMALNDGDTNVEVLPVVRKGSWTSKRLDNLGIDHRTAPFRGALDFKTKRILRQYIEGFKPDVIQSWMNRATRFLPKTAVPKVGRMGGYYNLKYYKKNVDYLIGNTEDICRYLRKAGWPKDKVKYVPNFTDPPSPDFREDKHEARDRYNIPHSAFVMLMAGRLHDCKGFDLALYAMRNLPKHVHALVVGRGDQKAELEAMVVADGLSERVHFVDWVSKMTPLAAASDVWLVPSRVEPLGNTVLDAWAHEVPVVASKAAGPKSLITQGKDGFLFDIDDDKGFVKAVLAIIEDRKKGPALATEGVKTLAENFSPEKVVKQYRAFYKEVMADE